MPAAPIYCDAHTHLDQYEQFAPDEIPAILERAQDAGVGRILLAGTTVESTARCIALADAHPMFYAGVGIHPMHARDPVDDAMYARLETLARDNPRVVCVSEVGLDYLPEIARPRYAGAGVSRAHSSGEKPGAAHHLSLAGIAPGGVSGAAGGERRASGRGDALFPGGFGDGACRH